MSLGSGVFTAPFNNMRIAELKMYHVLHCLQSCHRPLRKQVQYFNPFCLFLRMSVTIIIDGSIKCYRKFGFELQSLRVIEKCYKVSSDGVQAGLVISPVTCGWGTYMYM